MERAKKVLICTLVLLPLALGLKNFFDISNPLVWGDAPYFYKENLIELFNMPFAWDIRNSNFGSSQALTLWLFLPTFLQSFFYKLFGLNHEISVRIVFYFSYLLSAVGIYFLLSTLKLKHLAKAFGILFYLLNTYSLLLIDGGQIGVLLSYGLFPFVILTFINLTNRISLGTFSTAIFAHFLILNTDLRIAIIAIFFELIWWFFLITEKKITQVYAIIAVWLSGILLSGFWVYPFLYAIFHGGDQILNKNQDFIQLANSFYLFQPHFPENDFGNLSKTPIFYIFMPFILFLSLLGKKREPIKLGLMFLILIFLCKGGSAPFPEIYSFITSLPLGNAFRDSSKFYIPSILTASILIGFSVQYIQEKFYKYKKFWLFAIYIFLLISIYPVFSGGLTGVLGKNPERSDFNNIYELIKKDKFFYRTLWFNERPSLGFANWDHPGVSANLLFRERPFASMIDGDYDLFGFLHNKYIPEWYELLGIKYIFYPPYEREKSLTKKELTERILFENFISKIPGLKKLNLSISFPVYETENPKPKIFGQEKVLFVMGGEEIYNKLFSLKNFSLEKTGIVFLESCKFNPETIFNLEPESFGLMLTGDKNDLALSFFCDDLISPKLANKSQWAVNNSSEYLNWKSQLLERGVRNYDYDFNKGLAYSTKENERLEFKLNVPETKSYYLPVRFLTATGSAGLKVNFENNEVILRSSSAHKLEWSIIGPVFLEKGKILITLTNQGGLVAFNTLGFISQNTYDQKQYQIDEKLKTLTVLSSGNAEKLEQWFNLSSINANFLQINPVKYQAQVPKGANWLVFSERFDEDWSLQSYSFSKQPMPFYSIINGFYVGDIPYGYYDIFYRPQKKVTFGILLSLTVFSLVCFGLILHIISRGKIYEAIKKYIRNFKN